MCAAKNTAKIPQTDVFFPLGKNSKQPFTKWTEHLESVPITEGYNVGMRCLKTVVIDTDCELATSLALILLPKTKRVKTRKGMHFYFDGVFPGKKNMPKVDVIGTGGYVVAPPSTIDGFTYKFVDNNCDKAPWSEELLKTAMLISSITDITLQVIAKYEKGNRDSLIFGWSGVMYKSGVPIEIAKVALKYIVETTNDEEADSRYTVLENTYKKQKDAVAGYRMLRAYSITIPKPFCKMTQSDDKHDEIKKENKKRRTQITFEKLTEYIKQHYDIKKDAWKGVIYVNGEIAEEDSHFLPIYSKIESDLNEQYIVSKEKVFDAIRVIAKQNEYDWLVEKLEECHKLYLQHYEDDKLDVEKAPIKMAEIIKAKKPEIDAKKLEFFFCQAVNRVYNPGAFAKVCLILFGGQSTGKSSFCRYMGFERGHISTSFINEYNERDEECKISSAWIVECAEGFALSKGDMMFLKEFLSKNEATFVRKYERVPTVIKRRCAFIFTTNERYFLKDHTGEDRFAVIEITDKIDFNAFFLWRDIFLGYCVDKVKKGEFNPMIRVAELDDGHEEHKIEDDYTQDIILDWILCRTPMHKCCELIAVRDKSIFIDSAKLIELVSGNSTVLNNQIRNSIKITMEKLGFMKTRTFVNSARRTWYYMNIDDFDSLAIENAGKRHYQVLNAHKETSISIEELNRVVYLSKHKSED